MQHVATSVPLAEQYAALPWRYTPYSGLQFLLVTSRISRRWLLPKGWAIEGLSPEATAAQEALEEAGVHGEIHPRAVGSYDYVKLTRAGDEIPARVSVFPLRVRGTYVEWREAAERHRRWFTPGEAAFAVTEPGLAALLRRLATSGELLSELEA